jgi:hypothetical protein
MKNKEKKRKINIQNSQFIVINSILNSRKEKNNQDLIFNESNYYLNNDKIVSKYNNTISFTNSENNNKSARQKRRRILKNSHTNKEVISRDKIIQTPPYFYSIDNSHKTRYKYIIPNNKHINELNKNKLIERGKLIQRINYDFKNDFSKTFYNKLGKIKNIKYSRNKIFPILTNNKQKTTGFDSSSKNFSIFKEYFNNSSKEKQKKHHNLLTIENLYFQRRYDNNDNTKINYNYNCDFNNPKDEDNTNYKIYLLKNKYSVKEIKYPLYNNISRQYRVVNDSTAHLLEKIFNRQTLSNFNNKYTVAYKTNNSAKQENIKNLFSLLKKYQYSDKDKQSVFRKYNSMKKIKKYNNN